MLRKVDVERERGRGGGGGRRTSELIGFSSIARRKEGRGDGGSSERMGGQELGTAWQVMVVVVVLTQTWARGGVREGDAHRLTPQNLVPLPEAKMDPPMEQKKIQGYPSHFRQRTACFYTFFHFWNDFFSRNRHRQKKNVFLPPPCPYLSFKNSPLPKSFLAVPLHERKKLFPPC